MLQAASWYLILFALGWVFFPFTTRVFQSFEDHGYAFSKTLGLIALGFFHWSLTSFGLNLNTTAGVYISFVAMGVASVTFWIKDPKAFDFLRTPSKWAGVEIVFLVSFIFMVLVRSLNPEVSGTEKPMELAFINAIRHSQVFPPADPWMSGYSISYYYFGYLLTSTLSLLAGVSGSSAFNLMIATVFGLAGCSAFGLMKKMTAELALKKWIRSLLALAAPLFVLVVSNTEGFLEILHSLGVGWSNGGGFWRWLNIKDLIEQPRQPYGWDPRFWFWWRASRVVSDLDVFGNPIEVIDEFPFFSFLLGDLHPHVLAIPLVLVLVGMAIEFFNRGKRALSESQTGFLGSQRVFLLITGFVLGALGFTNTWDLPIYFGLFLILIVLFGTQSSGLNADSLYQVMVSAGILLVAAVLPFLPFYVAFSSQAGGFFPNLVNPTRAAQLWVMFLPLFIPVFILLIYANHEKKTRWIQGLMFGAGFTLALFLFSLALGFMINIASQGASLNLFGALDLNDLIKEGLVRRGYQILTLVTLVGVIGLSLGLLLDRDRKLDMDDLAAALTLLAGMLLIAPEFVYLRDQFGTRMNTIFKFYYQAWILLAIVSAYSVARIIAMKDRLWSGLLFTVVAISTLIGFAYPTLALPQKLDIGREGKFSELSLDGASQLERYAPNVIAAARWLESKPSAVIAEAVGGSYTEYARFATFSGQSAVLGWPGHESQWRGSYDLIPGRENDIRTLYETDDPEIAQLMLDRYLIDYVMVSDLERSAYQVNLEKFDALLPVVWESGSVRIYQAK